MGIGSLVGGVVGGIGGFLIGGPEGALIGAGIGGKLLEDNDDDSRRELNEQIRAYKEQTELTREELRHKQEETRAEKRRVEEKQIRALRNNYRAKGFLGGGGDNIAAPGTTDKLGK